MCGVRTGHPSSIFPCTRNLQLYTRARRSLCNETRQCVLRGVTRTSVSALSSYCSVFTDFAACSTPPPPHSRHASTLTPSLGRWAAAHVCFPPRCCKPGIKGIPRDVKLPVHRTALYRERRRTNAYDRTWHHVNVVGCRYGGGGGRLLRIVKRDRQLQYRNAECSLTF